MQPFNIGLSGKATDDNDEIPQNNDGDQAIFEDDEGDGDKEDEEEQAKEADYDNDNIDELAVLSEDEQTWVLEETAAVHDTITKVNNPITKQKMVAFPLLTLSLI